jgi:hypothetical protein
MDIAALVDAEVKVTHWDSRVVVVLHADQRDRNYVRRQAFPTIFLT